MPVFVMTPNLKPIFDKFAEDMAAQLLTIRTQLESEGSPSAEHVAVLMALCLKVKEDLEATKIAKS